MKRSAHEYAQALYDLVSTKPGEVSAIVKQFMSVLSADRRRDLLPAVLGELEQIEAKKAGRVIVKVTTAQPLSKDERELLEKELSQNLKVKAVTLREIVDPSVLGGIRIQVADRTIDHTAQAKLQQLAHRLSA